MPARGEGNRQGNGRGAERGGMPFRLSDAAVTACKDKNEGATCSFTGTKAGSDAQTTIDGTCRKAPGMRNGATTDTTLACMPVSKDGEGLKAPGDRSWNRSDRAATMKERKQAEINRIETRVQKVIDFLKSKDVSTTSIESDFEIFKGKANTVLDKVDALATLLKTDSPGQRDIEEKRAEVKVAGKDMITYFHDTLRPEIKKAVDTLKD